MSSTTWTPRAVETEKRGARLKLWRAVEAQHVASTTRLVDSLAEQAVLEQVLEESKPALPAGLPALDYLLFTPFRYPPPPGGSRFRGGDDPGVFYGADEVRTACAELGYWRWRFLTDSPALGEIGPVPHTLFQVNVSASTVDLRVKPFARDARLWTDPVSYDATQSFAKVARKAQVGLIRYQSVRDRGKGGCGALLDPAGFAAPRAPIEQQTWLLTVTKSFSAWQRDRNSFEFSWG